MVVVLLVFFPGKTGLAEVAVTVDVLKIKILRKVPYSVHCAQLHQRMHYILAIIIVDPAVIAHEEVLKWNFVNEFDSPGVN